MSKIRKLTITLLAGILFLALALALVSFRPAENVKADGEATPILEALSGAQMLNSDDDENAPRKIAFKFLVDNELYKEYLESLSATDSDVKLYVGYEKWAMVNGQVESHSEEIQYEPFVNWDFDWNGVATDGSYYIINYGDAGVIRVLVCVDDLLPYADTEQRANEAIIRLYLKLDVKGQELNSGYTPYRSLLSLWTPIYANERDLMIEDAPNFIEYIENRVFNYGYNVEVSLEPFTEGISGAKQLGITARYTINNDILNAYATKNGVTVESVISGFDRELTKDSSGNYSFTISKYLDAANSYTLDFVYLRNAELNLNWSDGNYLISCATATSTDEEALLNEIARLERLNAELTTSLAAKDEEISDLNVTIAELRASISEKDGTIANLQSQITTLESTVAAKQSEIDALNLEISELEENNAGLNGEIETLNARILSLEGELAIDKNTIIELKAELSIVKNERDTINAQYVKAGGELEKVTQERDELQQAINTNELEAQRRMLELQKEKADLQKEISKLEAEIKELKDVTSTLTGCGAGINDGTLYTLLIIAVLVAGVMTLSFTLRRRGK